MMVKQHMHSDRLVIHRPPSYKRSNTMSDVLMPQIMFSDDIIETMCPETISYSKAREKMRRSWKLGNDRYGSTKKKKGLFGSSSNGMYFSFHNNNVMNIVIINYACSSCIKYCKWRSWRLF